MTPTTTARRIAVLVGSLRAASLSRKLALALIGLAASELVFDMVEIGDLPLYNDDLESDPPAAWVRLREAVRACDGVIFVTPEYNRSVPGGLKNAIDVGSRPYGLSVFTAKPAAVISQSPGALGGFGANHALRQSLVFLDMPVLQQPEAYIGGSAKLFDEADELVNDAARNFLIQIMDGYVEWFERTAKAAGKAPTSGSALPGAPSSIPVR